MIGATRVPDVLNELLTLAGGITGLIVIDGEPTQGQTTDFIAVGHAQQGPGVVVDEAATDYGMAQPMETFDVSCQFVAWTGGSDLAGCRTRIAGYLTVWSAALLADPTLGGVAMLAQTGRTDWMQMQTEKGAMVIAQTTVHVQASKS